MFIGSKLYQRLLDAFTTCHPDNGQVGFRSCFFRSEVVGQWQDLFKGNLTLLLVLISCEDLLLRRSTKRVPMSCGWPSSWARMAVQVRIIWSRSLSPWNAFIWLVLRRWGWFGAVQRCYWRSWGERFEEQAAEEERGSRWSLKMWRKIFACFNKNRLLSLCKLCLNQIIFLRDSFPSKNCCSYGFCPNEGGEGLAQFFVTFSQVHFWFPPKCQ